MPSVSAKLTLAENQCTRCELRWRDRPGNHAEHTKCPGCGSIYWVWLNVTPSKAVLQPVQTRGTKRP